MGVENRIRLYESTLNNAMPIYRWLLSDSSVMDLGEDCTEFSITRAISEAADVGLSGKLLPVFRSPTHNKEEQEFYTEFSFTELNEHSSNAFSLFRIKDFSAIGHDVG